jgi:flagellar hook-associated protein 1
MGNLLASLLSSANALDAYNRVLEVTQNNVANAYTPGYAKQIQELTARPFDLEMGTLGGVAAGPIVSARSEFAEQNVRQQTTLEGAAQQNVDSLTAIESCFDISDSAGIPSALSDFFQAASAWGQNPNDTVTRQTVITQAENVAQAFQQTAAGLTSVAQNTETQLQQTVNQINSLVGQLQGYNKLILSGARNDAGVSAEVNATLEELSQYADITSMQQSDGSFTLLLNGQTPLLVGTQQYAIGYKLKASDTATYSGRPDAEIVAADGTDVTAQTTGGQLGALVNIHNQVLASYLGSGSQVGSLNSMAQQFADCVNGLLTNGEISDGVAGVPLFTYDTTNPTNVAATLAVDSTVTPSQLAAISSGPPYVSNGVPLAISGMANPQSAAEEIDGESYTAYYGNMAAQVGNLLSAAQDRLTVQQSTVAQAQDLRQQAQGVDLNEEAATLILFQKAYEANSKMISILDSLTEDVINMMST